MTQSVAMSSLQTKSHRLEAMVQPVSIERRERIRFPLGLRVRYRTLGRNCPFTGIGVVVNISSCGVLVATLHEISAGTGMELTIEWPALLDGQVPLQLVTAGRVVRSQPSGFAVVLRGHRFRTTSRKVRSIDAPWNDARKQTAERA